LAAPALFVVGCLLTLFFIIDRYWYRKEGILRVDPTPDTPKFGVDGAGNAWVFAGVIGLVLLSGYWRPGVSFHWAGTTVELQSLVRDLGLLVLTGLSLWRTPLSVRQGNQFSWGPMAEVAKLFIAIFVTMVPVLAMLKAGSDGAFASVARGVSDAQGQPLNWAYFWFAGGLSSFLDNAPTYLVFFNLASGDANVLMGPLASTLVAISAGSVFMGANSYIGNAPNFMVKAIVEERNLRMPSFLGYMLWSSCILLPLFGLVTWIWFL
jgi:Na+/H+ antiporter NhaD/arsenite permease-like protein